LSTAPSSDAIWMAWVTVAGCMLPRPALVTAVIRPEAVTAVTSEA